MVHPKFLIVFNVLSNCFFFHCCDINIGICTIVPLYSYGSSNFAIAKVVAINHFFIFCVCFVECFLFTSFMLFSIFQILSTCPSFSLVKATGKLTDFLPSPLRARKRTIAMIRRAITTYR